MELKLIVEKLCTIEKRQQLHLETLDMIVADST